MTTTDYFKIPLTGGPAAFRIIDQLLARSMLHMHDGSTIEAGGAAPAPVVTARSFGGFMPVGPVAYYGITIADAQGRESAISAVAEAELPAGVPDPLEAPALEQNTVGGFMRASRTKYQLSAYRNGDTFQETLPTPETEILLSPGTNTNSVVIVFPDLPDGADGWNIYRHSADGPSYGFVTNIDMSGLTPPTEWEDTGFIQENCGRLPRTANTTLDSGSVLIEYPGGEVPEGFTWKVYRTYVPGEWENTLVHHVIEETSEGSGIIAASYVDEGRGLLNDSPPPTNAASIPNPSKIDINLHTVGQLLASRIDGAVGGGGGGASLRFSEPTVVTSPGVYVLPGDTTPTVWLPPQDSPLGSILHTRADTIWKDADGNDPNSLLLLGGDEDAISELPADARMTLAVWPSSAAPMVEANRVVATEEGADASTLPEFVADPLDAATDLDPDGGITIAPTETMGPSGGQGAVFEVPAPPVEGALFLGVSFVATGATSNPGFTGESVFAVVITDGEGAEGLQSGFAFIDGDGWAQIEIEGSLRAAAAVTAAPSGYVGLFLDEPVADPSGLFVRFGVAGDEGAVTPGSISGNLAWAWAVPGDYVAYLIDDGQGGSSGLTDEQRFQLWATAYPNTLADARTIDLTLEATLVDDDPELALREPGPVIYDETTEQWMVAWTWRDEDLLLGYSDQVYAMFSADGTTWGEPVNLTGTDAGEGAEDPHFCKTPDGVLWRDSDGRALMATEAKIGAGGTDIAFYKSGIDTLDDWTRIATLPPGAPGAWDESLRASPVLIGLPDQVVMIWEGIGVGQDGEIGVAFSTDEGETFTVVDHPIFQRGPEGSWYDQAIVPDDIIQIGGPTGPWVMMVHGQNFDSGAYLEGRLWTWDQPADWALGSWHPWPTDEPMTPATATAMCFGNDPSRVVFHEGNTLRVARVAAPVDPRDDVQDNRLDGLESWFTSLSNDSQSGLDRARRERVYTYGLVAEQLAVGLTAVPWTGVAADIATLGAPGFEAVDGTSQLDLDAGPLVVVPASPIGALRRGVALIPDPPEVGAVLLGARATGLEVAGQISGVGTYVTLSLASFTDQLYTSVAIRNAAGLIGGWTGDDWYVQDLALQLHEDVTPAEPFNVLWATPNSGLSVVGLSITIGADNYADEDWVGEIIESLTIDSVEFLWILP